MNNMEKNTFEKKIDLTWIDKNIERAIRNAISKSKLDSLWEKTFHEETGGSTEEGNNKFMEETAKSRIDLGFLHEYKYALEKLNYPKEMLIKIISHENAHANKGESLGVEHQKYSIVIFNDKGILGVRQFTQNKYPDGWSMEEIESAAEKIALAPETYEKQELSDGDKKIAKRNQ